MADSIQARSQDASKRHKDCKSLDLFPPMMLRAGSLPGVPVVQQAQASRKGPGLAITGESQSLA